MKSLRLRFEVSEYIMSQSKRPFECLLAWKTVSHYRQTRLWIGSITSLGMVVVYSVASSIWVGCLFETRAEPQTLIFMGNSITQSDTNTLIGWNHTLGMAASKVENDYVHQTLQILKGRGREMIGILGDRDCDTTVCDGPIEEHLYNISQVYDVNPKYVVVQLGENSTEVEAVNGKLRIQYRKLLEALAKVGVRRIFCITPWGDTSSSAPRTKAVRLAMQGISGAELVDITHLSVDPANSGDPALFRNPDVLWHPGDAGMHGIANALVNVIMKGD